MEIITKIRNKIFNQKNNNTHIVKKKLEKGNYPKEVLEIHYEFEIATEKLLKEAQEIINNIPIVSTNKYDLLQKFGFKNVPEVKELKNNIEKKEINQELINLIQYYSINYPSNKFITEEQVKIICHKYNLVCGDVDRFKGFVPEKNLKEIENFKLKEKELNSISFTVNQRYLSNFNSENIVGKSFTCENATIKRCRTHFHFFKKGNNSEYAFQSEDGINFYAGDKSNIFGLRHLGDIRFTINNKLKICAPVKDMDISGLELKEGYKLEKKHIPDPVVLQPVKGGYLIVTAWGDEASDPIVVNQQMN